MAGRTPVYGVRYLPNPNVGLAREKQGGFRMELTTRNADLSDLAVMLQDQQARKLDMVVPASAIEAEDGRLRVTGAEPIIDENGVTSADGYYRPTALADNHVAQKLNIPISYLQTLRASRIDLYDANVNGWLHGTAGDPDDEGYVAPDSRSFMLRTFRGDEPGSEGIARAFLSNGYKIIDHLDVLTAALDAIRETGVDTKIVGCDLTDRMMRVRVAAPQIAALAPTLLRGYRNPFEGQPDRLADWQRHGGFAHGDEPVVFAGFELANSETGNGASTLTPRIIVLRCLNGLKLTVDVVKSVHLGGKLDDGVIRWSEDTQRKELELVSAKTRDAVATFLNVDYVEQAIAKLEAKSDTPVHDAQGTVTTVCKQLRFSEEHTTGVLDHFIRGGQMTAGGVMQAVTSFAQTIDDGDVAAEFEAAGVRALDLAAQA